MAYAGRAGRSVGILRCGPLHELTQAPRSQAAAQQEEELRRRQGVRQGVVVVVGRQAQMGPRLREGPRHRTLVGVELMALRP